MPTFSLPTKLDVILGAFAITESATRAPSVGRLIVVNRHLNDDLQIVTPGSALIAAPPVDLWPRIINRCAVPRDRQTFLLAELAR